MPLHEPFIERFELPVLPNRDVADLAGADGTVACPLGLERVCVNRIVTRILRTGVRFFDLSAWETAAAISHHHVAVQVGGATRCDLKGLVAAGGYEGGRPQLCQCAEGLGMRLTGDNGVGARDGRNNVLDDTLGQAPCDAVDVELLRPGKGLHVEPIDCVGVVGVDLLVCTKT